VKSEESGSRWAVSAIATLPVDFREPVSASGRVVGLVYDKRSGAFLYTEIVNQQFYFVYSLSYYR
jgi:hypothetical protein